MAPLKKESVSSWMIVSDMYDSSTKRMAPILRQKTLSSSLNYRDRVYIATYCWVNGVNKKLLEEALYLNKNLTQKSYSKLWIYSTISMA